MSEPGKYQWGENEETFLNRDKAYDSFDDDLEETRLFPDDLLTGAASATECTGLIQVAAPCVKDLYKVYDDVYSYRKSKPRKEENQ